MDFTYIIENDGVTIITCNNALIESIIIPESIEGYPVTNINCGIFWCKFFLKTINNKDILDGINFIGNKFIYYNNRSNYGDNKVFTIKHQIGDEYVVDYNGSIGFLIKEKFFFKDFIPAGIAHYQL